MGAIRSLSAVLLALAVAGCGADKRPKTYEVSGKVTLKGGAALAGGTVRLEPKEASDLSVNGEISPDGSFTLTTYAGGAKLPGAPEGSYTVSVVGPLNADRSVDQLVVTQPTVTVKAGEANR